MMEGNLAEESDILPLISRRVIPKMAIENRSYTLPLPVVNEPQNMGLQFTDTLTLDDLQHHRSVSSDRGRSSPGWKDQKSQASYGSSCSRKALSTPRLKKQFCNDTDSISGVTYNWMRINGALQPFRNLLSSTSNVRAQTQSVGSEDQSILPTNTMINIVPNRDQRKYIDKTCSIDSEAPTSRTITHTRLHERHLLFNRRKTIANMSISLALFGICLMILETEISAYTQEHNGFQNYFLKFLILLSTFVLLFTILLYYTISTQLFMAENTVTDWRLAMSRTFVLELCTETTICAICPLLYHCSMIDFSILDHGIDDPRSSIFWLRVDNLLSIMMFGRFYLIPRVLVLNSKLFTNTAFRSIGALNQVKFNTRFVLKTLMTHQPGTVLLIFIGSLWAVAGWILRMCESDYDQFDEAGNAIVGHQNYLNSLWVIAITHLSIGYGDITPITYCGRTVAVIAGIVLKNAAANVLRQTWLIYKHKNLVKNPQQTTIRLQQRKFLAAIQQLRDVKHGKRKLVDNSTTMSDLGKTCTMTYDVVLAHNQWQELMENRMEELHQQMEIINDALINMNNTMKITVARKTLVKSERVEQGN